VIARNDPVAALQTVDDPATPIDVVVTDIVMPCMNGRELADRIGQRRPHIPVVFISGYADDVIFGRTGLRTGTLLLQKPFRVSDLDQALRAVITGTGGMRAISA
jgi:CheY-like chemotaxis protein